MLRPTVKRGLMLDFIADKIPFVTQTNSNRVLKLNDISINDGDIIYLISREFRLEDNWALIFAMDLAEKYNRKFKIITILDKIQTSKRQRDFLYKELEKFKNNLVKNGIDFEILQELPDKMGALIIDFNPIVNPANFYKNADYAVYEVDSHNIIPARFISDKQEFSAATLRRKVYGNIAGYLTEFSNKFEIKESQSRKILSDFIENKLEFYTELKNDPNKDFTSNLSPYQHFGLISSQRIALEVLNSKASRENKEAFLEELIVRKELADNFCLYAPNYKNFDGILNWAKESLNAHRHDIRTYAYDLEEFEHSKTHDEFWNAMQRDLLKTGRIHGYLRMYWAKKILEWSKTPEDALKIAIYLNDEYALDGNDPNGYVGILWSIGGIHDRAFANRMVTGKIRYMSLNGCMKKFDVKEYIARNEDKI